MDVALALLKLVAITISGIFGAIGVLVNFKDEQGKITIWGKRALAIIIISSAIAVSVHLLETIQEDIKDKSAAERSEDLLRNLNRILQPIQNMKVSYIMRTPLDHAEITNYLTRLDKTVKELLQKNLGATDGLIFIIERINDTPSMIGLKENSSLYPDRNLENIAFRAFEFITFTLHFYKTPIQVKETPWLASDSEAVRIPNLSITFGSSIHEPTKVGGQRAKHQLNYRILQKTMEIEAQQIETGPQDWHGDGTIISTVDLIGSQMFIEPLLAGYNDQKTREVLEHMVKWSRTRYIWFMLSPYNRIFSISERDMTTHIAKNGLPIYEFRFPKTENEFNTSFLKRAF